MRFLRPLEKGQEYDELVTTSSNRKDLDYNKQKSQLYELYLAKQIINRDIYLISASLLS